MLYSIIFIITTKIVVSQKSSPCPQIFSYEPIKENDKWYGTLSLQNSNNSTENPLQVIFDEPVVSFGIVANWFSQNLSSNNTVFEIRKDGISPLVRFFVQFNPSKAIPYLKMIKLNGKVICPTQNEHKIHEKQAIHVRPTISNPTIESPIFADDFSKNIYQMKHKQNMETALPTTNSNSKNILSDNEENYSEEEYYQGDFGKQTVTKKSNLISETKCGISAARATPLLLHGEDTWPGQWPWHAALYRTTTNLLDRNLKYFCGATLITEQYVIVSAHCVYSKHLRPTRFLVSLGKHNLKQYGPHIQDRTISDLYIHPQFDSKIFRNDIAVLKLSEPIMITDFVRPCCLWGGDSNLDDIMFKEGVVIGWDDEGESTLKQAKIPIVPVNNCGSMENTHNDTYCAGFTNGSSACTVKSMGAMVFPRVEANGIVVWQARGILPEKVGSEHLCDKSQFLIFTDVAKYKQWILSIISKS